MLSKFENALYCFNRVLKIDPLHKRAGQHADFIYQKKGADIQPSAAATTVSSDIGVVSMSLGSDIFDISLDCYRKVEKQLNESYALDIQRCRTVIIYETCFLYLHYIDRWVFSAFDPQYRDEVMESIESGLLDYFLSLGGNAQVLHHGRNKIKERARQYARCAGFDYFFGTYLQILKESCDIQDDRIFASLGTLIIDRLSCLPLNYLYSR